jgi:excisionase family DNA binding protein
MKHQDSATGPIIPDMNADAAAAYFHTTARHVRQLWWERRIAGFKLGGKLRFSKVDLDAFIAASRVEAKP